MLTAPLPAAIHLYWILGVQYACMHAHAPLILFLVPFSVTCHVVGLVWELVERRGVKGIGVEKFPL
jgi:hypothetical protein